MRSGLVVLILLLIVTPLKAQAVRVVTEHFPPYNFELNKQAQGLATEVVQAVLQQLNLDVDIEFYPWARAYELAKTEKNVLIYSIARVSEREKLFKWAGAIAPFSTSFYKLKANKDIKLTSLEQAKQYDIGVTLNSAVVTYLQRHQFPHLKIRPTGALNIRLLANNRIDLIAYDEASFSYALKKEGLNSELFEKVYELDRLTDRSRYLYMAFSLNSDEALVEDFSNALLAIKANGIYEKIRKKYITVE